MSKTIVCTIATGNYVNYLPEWVRTAKEYFHPTEQTDILLLHNYSTKQYEADPKILEFLIERQGWPFETLFRFKRLLKAWHLIQDYDFFYYVDADMKFAHPIGLEILPIFQNTNGLVGVIHPGFYQEGRRGTFTDNPESVVYIPPDYRGKYFQGCVWGGTVEAIYKMLKICDAWVDADRLRGIIDAWWDENFLNYYFKDNQPEVQLHPGYAFPENWSFLPFQKKIIHIAKDEQYMRKETINVIY
jgi:hypothetical protein